MGRRSRLILLIAWFAVPSVAPKTASANLLQTLTNALTNQCIPTSDQYCGDFSRATPRTTTVGGTTINQCLCPCDYQYYDAEIRACRDCAIETAEGATTCGDTSCTAGFELKDYAITSCLAGFELKERARICSLTAGQTGCQPGFELWPRV